MFANKFTQQPQEIMHIADMQWQPCAFIKANEYRRSMAF